MAKRKYPRLYRVPADLKLSLPAVGSLWEKSDTHWNHEVAVSGYAEDGNPQVKFYPLPSEWISWEELHKNYRYMGKASKLEGE